ncbi:PREDICTED: uncharacterized protein LOC106101628 [Papilio polytes]|uniref:uncharacterized protein LOC106101628 n=1 Tax=Papilio polytes TaxID=76194 RepID=UPI0006760233|nr:PREDICTED: uncharacterized protein LOC106101628 [Papilio polytes]
MKPPSDTFICPRRSISFCPRNLESKTQIKTIYPQQFKIYNVCSPCVLQPKEAKLLQKLLKSRAVYDDTRHQVCESLTSIDGKCGKSLSPCEAQKIKAIVQFINTVDKGAALLPVKDRKQTTCCNEKSSCTRPCSRERSVQAQEPCAEVTPEKPRKQTNVFIKRVVKKCCNRTTCVQVEAIESVDDDSRSAKGKSSCDTVMKCFPLEKNLLNSLPKECRKVVKSCTKLDCSKGNDIKMPCIARCCIKKKICDDKPLVQVKSSKNIGCQKETTCRKASQAKISLFKKGTRTDPYPKGGCCAKVKAKLKPKPCISARSLNSIIKSREKLCGKQCPKKIILKKCDVCKCNKKTQTKKVAKKDVKQNAKGKSAKKNASCIKLNVEDKKKDNTTAIVCVKMFKDERQPNCIRTKSETFRFGTYVDKSRPPCPVAVYKCRKNNTKPKCRSQSCNTLDFNQYMCVPAKVKKPKKSKCPGEKSGTCPAKQKQECPAKQKPECPPKEKPDKKCCTAKKHEPCPAKPPKCQVVRIGSNFSFHIEFYKNRTKERRPAKGDKKGCKNKGSSTKCEPPACKTNKVKTVATATKPMCCSVCYCIKKFPQKSKPKPVKPAAPSFKPASCSVCYCIKPNPGKRKPKSSCLNPKPTCCSVSYSVKANPRRWRSKPACPNYEKSSTVCLNYSDNCLKAFSQENIVNNCCYEKNIKYQCRVLQAYTLKNIFKRNKHNQIAKDFVRKYIDKDIEPVLLQKNSRVDTSCSVCSPKPKTFFRKVCWPFFQIVEPLNLPIVNRLCQFCLQLYFCFTIQMYSLASKFCQIQQCLDSDLKVTIKQTKNVIFETALNILDIFILTFINY